MIGKQELFYEEEMRSLIIGCIVCGWFSCHCYFSLLTIGVHSEEQFILIVSWLDGTVLLWFCGEELVLVDDRIQQRLNRVGGKVRLPQIICRVFAKQERSIPVKDPFLLCMHLWASPGRLRVFRELYNDVSGGFVIRDRIVSC